MSFKFIIFFTIIEHLLIKLTFSKKATFSKQAVGRGKKANQETRVRSQAERAGGS